MQCNIDSRGKTARIIIGSIVEGVGVVIVVLWFLGMLPLWAGIVGGVTALSGVLVVFEGMAGWCAVRAMGFKTPL